MMDKITALIAKHEGLRLFPYRDTVGKLTIGYGRNLDDVGIDEREAEELLKTDVVSAGWDASKFSWYQDLDKVRRAVIINMVFNLGINRFKKFKKTINLIDLGMYEDAAVEMLNSRWSDQVGSRAIELSEMMRTGEWQ